MVSMKVVFYEMNRCLFMVFLLLSFALNFFDLKMLIEKKKFQIKVLINNEWVALIIAAWRGLIFWLEITHTYIKFDQQNFTVCLKEVIFRSEFEPAFCEVICFLLHRDGLCSAHTAPPGVQGCAPFRLSSSAVPQIENNKNMSERLNRY